jgi:hypothetical protein
MAVGTILRLPLLSYCPDSSSPSGVPTTGIGSGGGGVSEQVFQRQYVVGREVDSRFNLLWSAEVYSKF